jgi:hypothetical protein
MGGPALINEQRMAAVPAIYSGARGHSFALSEARFRHQEFPLEIKIEQTIAGC